MSEQSDRMLMLLRELAAFKDGDDPRTCPDAVARRKRRKEIGKEMKRLAARKKQKKEDRIVR